MADIPSTERWFQCLLPLNLGELLTQENSGELMLCDLQRLSQVKAPHAYSLMLSCEKSDYPRPPCCKEAKPQKSPGASPSLSGLPAKHQIGVNELSEDSSSQPLCQPQFSRIHSISPSSLCPVHIPDLQKV